MTLRKYYLTLKKCGRVMALKRSKHIELSTLQQFSSVANSETITQAAKRIGISQSAVSQTIKQLEEQIGVDLIVRRSKPIKLTPSGEVLKRYARKMLSDNTRVINDIKMAATGGLLNLRVGMVDSFGESLGLEFIRSAQIMVKRVSLQQGYRSSFTGALNQREIDLLITSDRGESHRLIERHSLICDPFLIIAPKQGGVRSSVQELSEQLPFIHYMPGSRLGAQTDSIARRLNVQLDTRYELDSNRTLLRFVQAGMGWAIVSAMCLAPYPKLLEGLDLINLNDGSYNRTIYQLSRQRELSDMPERFASISRTLFNDQLKPKLENIAPWLADQAYSIKP